MGSTDEVRECLPKTFAVSTHYVPYVPDSPIFGVDDWFRVDELSDTFFFPK